MTYNYLSKDYNYCTISLQIVWIMSVIWSFLCMFREKFLSKVS